MLTIGNTGRKVEYMRKNVQEIYDKLNEMKLGKKYDHYLATCDQGATECYFAGIDSMTANDVRDLLDEMLAEEQREEFREIVAQTGLSLSKFAERYEIPLRSVENWSGGQRTAPDYVIKLLARVVAEDFQE